VEMPDKLLLLELVDREEEYEVESITNHRRRAGELYYLVKWKD